MKCCLKLQSQWDEWMDRIKQLIVFLYKIQQIANSES